MAENINEAMQKISRLKSAVHDALENEVADVVKNYLVESAYENVYEAYTPEFYSRRYGTKNKPDQKNGGIMDKESVKIDVHDTTLTAKDEADWQQLWGGTRPSGMLADAIATGDSRFYMGNAGPRPFHEEAARMAVESGEVEDALRNGLERQGYQISDGTIGLI